MGKVIMSGVSKGMTKPEFIAVNFADTSWAKIIEACQTNSVPDTWVVGDQKVMTIDGTDYLIDIIGKNHDTYSDGSGTAPLTFQMHDCYGTGYAMNSTDTNQGAWRSCAMYSTHLPAILSLMPNEVQAGIREVGKLNSCGNTSTLIDNPVPSKLFLLSEIEVFGSTNYSLSGEGTQYAYYAAGNSKVKTINGTADYWWLRSPRSSNTTSFCRVNASGSYAQTGASSACGVSFAFCF